MRVRTAALFLGLVVAGMALSGGAFAMTRQGGTAPPPDSSNPPPPAPAPAPGRPAAPSPSKSAAPSIALAYPMDYRSIVDRIAADPNNPALLNELGNYLANHGRLQSAIVQYVKALKIQKDLGIVWNNLGVAYTALAKYVEGEWAYRRAINVNPAYALAYYNLGANFDQRGDYDQALTYYQRAIELDPTLLDVRVNPQIATNRHVAEILVKSYLDRGGSVVLPLQSMYPAKPRRQPQP
jgi:tetratricopeptide (TPR) repeat protein